ncbi:hypothetical protein Hanom_Chr08g00701031 [Helianthus anomalus]
MPWSSLLPEESWIMAVRGEIVVVKRKMFKKMDEKVVFMMRVLLESGSVIFVGVILD